MGKDLIGLTNLSFGYSVSEYPAVSQINLAIRQGETVCLTGPSGCGKSTLLRLIAGVLRPSTGKVTFEGNPELRGWSKLSLVPQDSLLLPWRTVLANVRLPLELQSRASEAAMNQKAKAALELVNLSGVESKYPNALSGGMRQRAALARALVEHPQVLLLDEPFASLDDLTRNQLHLELLRIQTQTDVTMIMVTHNIFEAVFLADRVVVMGEKPGRIIGTVTIHLPKPRQLKMMATPDFSAAVGALQKILAQDREDYQNA